MSDWIGRLASTGGLVLGFKHGVFAHHLSTFSFFFIYVLGLPLLSYYFRSSWYWITRVLTNRGLSVTYTFHTRTNEQSCVSRIIVKFFGIMKGGVCVAAELHG